MNKKRYISAFSILETVVSMVVTAIVLGITFVLFSLLSERMADFKEQNQFTADFNRFSFAVTKDLFENESVTINDSSLTCYRDGAVPIEYKFNNNYLVRVKESYADTFKIPLKRIDTDTLISKNRKLFYVRIRCSVLLNEEITPLVFFKKLNTNELIKNTANGI